MTSTKTNIRGKLFGRKSNEDNYYLQNPNIVLAHLKQK